MKKQFTFLPWMRQSALPNPSVGGNDVSRWYAQNNDARGMALATGMANTTAKNTGG
jgi:hypothetical protein